MFPEGRDRAGRVSYTQLTYAQLDDEATRIARGLIRLGARPGSRLAMFVPPSLESIALTFGVFRSGAVCTLIDPGMGRQNVFGCLDQCDPEGFIAIPIVQLVRWLKSRRYPQAKLNIVVGPQKNRVGCTSYGNLLQLGDDESIEIPRTRPTDPAAIIFTSGSIKKLNLYRALNIPEVWFWEDGVLAMYHLRGSGDGAYYEKIGVSEAVPGLDVALLKRCILMANHVEALKTFQANLVQRQD